MNTFGYEQSSETSSSIAYPEESTRSSKVISTREVGADSINSFPQERVYVGEVPSSRTSWTRRNTAPYSDSPPVREMEQNRWGEASNHYSNQTGIITRMNCGMVCKE